MRKNNKLENWKTRIEAVTLLHARVLLVFYHALLYLFSCFTTALQLHILLHIYVLWKCGIESSSPARRMRSMRTNETLHALLAAGGSGGSDAGYPYTQYIPPIMCTGSRVYVLCAPQRLSSHIHAIPYLRAFLQEQREHIRKRQSVYLFYLFSSMLGERCANLEEEHTHSTHTARILRRYALCVCTRETTKVGARKVYTYIYTIYGIY